MEDEVYNLAKEVYEKAGMRFEYKRTEETARTLSPHKTRRSRNEHQSSRHYLYNDPNSQKIHDGGGDAGRRRKSEHSYDDYDIDYENDQIKKMSAPGLRSITRELEKLCEWNKELQKKSFRDDRTIRKLNEKVAGLKEQLDDETEGTMKLVADREHLKLQIQDYHRKFFAALLLSGLTEKDVSHFFQKNPRANEITDEMINIKQEIKKCSDQEQENKYESMNPLILAKRVTQLEHSNEQLNARNHDRVNALKNEIHIMKQDHSKAVDDLQHRVQDMSKRLAENNDVLHAVLTENLKLKDSRAEIESVFKKERNQLLEFLKSNDIDHTNFLDAPNKLIENAQLDAATIKKLQNLVSRTQNDLIRRENEIESYRNEFLKMEKRVSRAELEKDEFKKLYEETIKKMNEKNSILIKRAENIDKRRKLEAAGFQKDIKNLGQLLTDLQNKLNYCLTTRYEQRMLDDFGETELFRNCIRCLSLDENAKKRIIDSVRADHKRKGPESSHDHNHHKKLDSLVKRISSPSRKLKPPSVKTSQTKFSSNRSKPEVGNVIKLKLCKLSTPKDLKSKDIKDRPNWVDITTKDYSGKSKSSVPTKAAHAQKRKSEGKSTSKAKSVAVQYDQLDSKLELGQGVEWLDEELDALIELLNAPGAYERSPERSRRHSNDENNNTVEQIQKQLNHATSRLNELQRNTKLHSSKKGRVSRK